MGRIEATGDAGGGLVVLEDGGKFRVDAAVFRVGCVRVGAVGFAEDLPGERERIAADVHQAAAGQVWREADVVRVAEQTELERGRHRANVLEFLVGEFEGAFGARVILVHERLHQCHVAVVAVVDDVAGLCGVDGQWLLTEHVNTGVGGLLRPLRVERVRQRNVDGVNTGVLEEVIVAS